MSEDKETWGTQEVCRFFRPQLSYKELKWFEQNGIIKKTAYNKWPIPETIQSLAEFWRDKAEDDRAASEKALLTKAKREQEEMKAAVMRGELCNYESLMRVIDDEQAQVRTAITTKLPRVISLLDLPASSREREIIIRSALTKELRSIVRGKIERKKRKAPSLGED